MIAARKLLLAVSVLHDQGFEKLRLNAGLSPSGGFWRFRLFAKGSPESSEDFSIGTDLELGWGDCETTSPEELADIIAQKFGNIVVASKGEDQAYVQWFNTIIQASEPEGVFIEYWDAYDGTCEGVRVINCASQTAFPYAPV